MPSCMLYIISCPADGNVGKKHGANLAKYNDLQVEAMLDPGGSRGLWSLGHRYCMVAGHYSR